MAQSPEQNAGSSEIVRYDLGWNAINAMLRAGRSLSGYERNCCFLNTGRERFANVSAAVNLDFVDDGRVLTLADWDYDGDIDLWIANRSGPQARYVRNNTNRASANRTDTDGVNTHKPAAASTPHFIAIRLQGTQSNRDGIGARVTLKSSSRQQSTTLRAGEGYLSQSSKWLHFGLGSHTEAAELEIRWPAGSTQTITQLKADRFYVIREGTDKAERWQPPQFPEYAAAPFEAPPISDQARIVLLRPIPLPAIKCQDTNGKTLSVTSPAAKPRLINLWATWCKPCLLELAEWKQHAADFEAAGLDIVAVNVDHTIAASEDGVSQPTDATAEATAKGTANPRDVLARLQLPFQIAFGNETVAAKFDVMQRSLLSRQRPLPVPSSFLVDREGRLQVVYKGPVSVAQLLADVRLIDAPRDERLAAATPLPGKWLSPPGGSTPLYLALKFVEGGYAEDAQDYIRTLMKQSDTHPEYVTAALMNLLGAMAADERNYKEAVGAFSKSIQLDPENRQSRVELGTLLLGGRQGAAAEPHFRKLLETAPNDPELITKLGHALLQQGKFNAAETLTKQALSLRQLPGSHWQLAEISIAMRDPAQAILSYEAAIRMQPERAKLANNLAWLLATSQDAALRSGKRAVELASLIAKSNPQPTAGQLDTLATAHAAAGNFEAATRYATQAVQIAEQAKNDRLEARIRARLELFRRKQPFREQL